MLEKEAAIEKLSTEMKTAVSKLEFQIEMLRDRNNELVSDLIVIQRVQQLNEERIETEKVELKTKAAEEKESLIRSYEEAIEVIKADSKEKEEKIAELVMQISSTEETLQKQVAEKQEELEMAKTAHEERLVEISTTHREEVKALHKDYERVLTAKEEKFFDEQQKLSAAHQETIEALQNGSQTELKELQDESRMAFSALERKLSKEKEVLQQDHAKQLADVNNSYEEKLAVVNKRHEAVVEQLNKNIEEAMDNVSFPLSVFLSSTNSFLLFSIGTRAPTKFG